MDEYEKLARFLRRHGWSLDCYNPLEISYDYKNSKGQVDDTCQADRYAAELVIECLRRQDREARQQRKTRKERR